MKQVAREKRVRASFRIEIHREKLQAPVGTVYSRSEDKILFNTKRFVRQKTTESVDKFYINFFVI